jgi:ketosteroid isomerase-like protein
MIGSSRSAILAGLAILAGIGVGWQLRDLGMGARASDGADALARDQVARFYDALSGNGALGEVLGDAFQVMRTDGSRYDRAGYAARPPLIKGYKLAGLKAAEADGVLTATFFATTEATVDGVSRSSIGQPRLAVFSKATGDWKLQAFANLGTGLTTDTGDVGRKAVEAWVGAVSSGDAERVRGVLAPEFQILRSDGSSYDATAYLSHLPKFDAAPVVDGLVVTGYGDYLVARYSLTTGGSVGGKSMASGGNRMTVFRRSGDVWLAVAHANFSPIGK